MSAHTPGPWFAGRALRNAQECIVGDGDAVVCFMPDHTIGCTYRPEDARLIAMAPDMLDVLERVLEVFSEHYSDTYCIQCVRRVVAKAKGERA